MILLTIRVASVQHLEEDVAWRRPCCSTSELFFVVGFWLKVRLNVLGIHVFEKTNERKMLLRYGPTYLPIQSLIKPSMLYLH
jgi:hypothetical protein